MRSHGCLSVVLLVSVGAVLFVIAWKLVSLLIQVCAVIQVNVRGLGRVRVGLGRPE